MTQYWVEQTFDLHMDVLCLYSSLAGMLVQSAAQQLLRAPHCPGPHSTAALVAAAAAAAAAVAAAAAAVPDRGSVMQTGGAAATQAPAVWWSPCC